MGRVVSEVVWQERRAFVARWRSSGLTLAAFARREGVAYGRALAWRARLLPAGDGAAPAAGGGRILPEVVVRGEPAGWRPPAPASRPSAR
jgi:hypothetical protein